MSLLSYLELKQHIWDLLTTKIADGDLEDTDGNKPNLYWGAREPEDVAKVLNPEIQLISDVQAGGESISDQSPFYFPKRNSLIVRVMAKSPIDRKTAESFAIDLAQKVMNILKDEAEMSGQIINPGIDNIRMDELEMRMSYYFAADILYSADSRD